MRAISVLFLSFVLVSGIAACAQEDPVQIKVEIDRTSAATGDLLTCKIIITSPLRDLPAPKLPSFQGFALVSQAQSSTVSLKETAVNTVLVFAFVITPVRTGQLEIEPAVVTVDGKEYSSEKLSIEVKEGSRRLPPSDLPRYSL